MDRYQSQYSDVLGQNLCRTCSEVDFKRYRYDQMYERSMGRFQDIVSNRHCPSCRLMVEALELKLSAARIFPDDTVLLSNAASWELGIETSSHSQLNPHGYSNLHDLRSVAKKCDDLPNRFVVSILQDPLRRGIIQYAADEEERYSDSKFLGRFVDPNHLPISRVKKWMNRCDDFHGETCEKDGARGRHLPMHLRLINVVKMALVRLSVEDIHDYVTLSYVWGEQSMKAETGISSVKLRRADIQVDERGQECTPLPQSLPRTIEDAIWLTRELGYEYLWVDALCIVQDDDSKDMNLHLKRMDAIYSCSRLTIVAASAIHADVGLAGIGTPRKLAPSTAIIRSCKMAAMAPSFSELEDSRSLIWNTRGWTFQEKVLAKRLLFITDYQAYFRCSESIWLEEAAMETEKPSKSMAVRSAKYRWAGDRQSQLVRSRLSTLKMFIPQLKVDDESQYSGKFTDYAAAIFEYSRRDLHNDKDVLIAVKGILSTLRADLGKFICGLPENYFLRSLLWYADAGDIEIPRDNDLPTWSWASWKHQKGVRFEPPVARIADLLNFNMFMMIMASSEKLPDATVKSSVPASSSRRASNLSNSSTNSLSTGTVSNKSTQVAFRSESTKQAFKSAYSNMASSFGGEMFTQSYVLRAVYLYKRRQARSLLCKEPLAYSTMANLFEKRDRNQKKKPWQMIVPLTPKIEIPTKHKRQARRSDTQCLAFDADVIYLRIGSCLSTLSAAHDDECGVYELLAPDGSCVGEVWTTLRLARKGQRRSLQFLTISQSFAFQHVQIADKWIPRWPHDSKLLPKSKVNFLFQCCETIEQVVGMNSSKHFTGSSASFVSNSTKDEQLSIRSFSQTLLTAKKGDALPSSLWTTVNLLLVERDRTDRYKRCGRGKVILEAWQVNKESEKEPVILI